MITGRMISIRLGRAMMNILQLSYIDRHHGPTGITHNHRVMIRQGTNGRDPIFQHGLTTIQNGTSLLLMCWLWYDR